MNEPSFDASSEPVLDSHSKPGSPEQAGAGQAGAGQVNPFLGIHFRCCRTYGRIYRVADRSEYAGRCPRCQAQVRVPIRRGGSASRFYNAG